MDVGFGKYNVWRGFKTTLGKVEHFSEQLEQLGFDPNLVVAETGWWFPEKAEEKVYDWDKSNYNILTDDDTPGAKEVGSNNTRGYACNANRVSPWAGSPVDIGTFVW